MKTALVLLTDRETFNLTSRLAWDVFQRFGIGIGVRRLPPHVSLKQPFDCDDLAALADFAVDFAASIAPLPLELATCDLWEHSADAPTSGTLFVQVRETPTLRELHNRLNRELSDRFRECRADFDGDSYRFHLTLAAGGATVSVYHQALSYCESVWTAWTFTARELALLVYEQDASGEWQRLTYAILPLGTMKGEGDAGIYRTI